MPRKPDGKGGAILTQTSGENASCQPVYWLICPPLFGTPLAAGINNKYGM